MGELESVSPDAPDYDDFDILDNVGSTSESGTAAGAPDSGATTPTPTTPTPTTTDSTDPSSASVAQSQVSAGTQPDPNALPERVVEQLRVNGLRPIPGETVEAAHDRLITHLRARGDKFRNDWERQQQAHTQAINELREQMAPMLRAHWEAEQARRTAELAEQLPEPGTPEYQTYLLEQNLFRMQEKEEQDALQQQQAQEQAEEQARLDEIHDIDSRGYDAITRALGAVEGVEPDPEFQAAYRALSTIAISAAEQYFPGEDPAKIQEFVALSQQLDVRRLVKLGVDPVAALKSRYQAFRAAFGGGAVGASAAAAAVVPPAVPTPTQPQPQLQPQPVPSPTAQRMQAESTAANRRFPLTVPVTPRPTPAADGRMLDASDFESSEDYVEAVLAGLVPESSRSAPPKKRQAS